MYITDTFCIQTKKVLDWVYMHQNWRDSIDFYDFWTYCWDNVLRACCCERRSWLSVSSGAISLPTAPPLMSFRAKVEIVDTFIIKTHFIKSENKRSCKYFINFQRCERGCIKQRRYRYLWRDHGQKWERTDTIGSNMNSSLI